MDQSILENVTYSAARVLVPPPKINMGTVIHTRMHAWVITVHKSISQRCVVHEAEC